MSNLVMAEEPLCVQPTLAKNIGLNEAIMFQQMNYWMRKCAKFRDGRYWIYNSVNQWAEQFPFWSKDTIKRTIKSLRDQELIVTGNYNKDRRDKTLWYSLNMDHPSLRAEVQIATSEDGKEPSSDDGKLHQPLPENTTENTTVEKDSSSSDDVSANVREVFDFWKQRMGKANNTKLTAVRRKKIISRLRDGYTMEDLKLAIINCSKSDFHMGKNDSGTAHNDIELICRSDDKLEWFMHSVCARPQSTRTKRTIDEIVTDPTTDYAEGLKRCEDGSYEITDEFLFGRG